MVLLALRWEGVLTPTGGPIIGTRTSGRASHQVGAVPGHAGRGRALSRGQALAAQPSPAWPEAAVSAHSGYGRSADADDPRSYHKAKLVGRSTSIQEFACWQPIPP
jgi:hypothetical protein